MAQHRPQTEPSRAARRNAAVALILRNGSPGRLEALFIQRAEHPEDPWSGHMALPGGRQDPGDDDIESVARRETLEEVGIDLAKEGRLLGRLDDITGGRLGAYGMAVTPFVYHCDAPYTLAHNHEVAATVWVPLAHLGHPANVREYVFPIDPLHRTWASIPYGPYTIWGLTYRIVANFVELFGVSLPKAADNG